MEQRSQELHLAPSLPRAYPPEKAPAAPGEAAGVVGRRPRGKAAGIGCPVFPELQPVNERADPLGTG